MTSAPPPSGDGTPQQPVAYPPAGYPQQPVASQPQAAYPQQPPAPYQQQPVGYPQQYAYPPQAYVAARPTNVLAVITLVLALVGISIGAVITGHISLSQLKKTGEQGRGMAIAGLIIGYVGCAFWVLFWIATLALPLLWAGIFATVATNGTAS
jgi:hypothetical protein